MLVFQFCKCSWILIKHCAKSLTSNMTRFMQLFQCWSLSPFLARWDEKWSTAAISGLEMPSSHFSFLKEFGNICTALFVMKCFPPYNPFPIDVKCSKPLTSPSLFSSQMFWQAHSLVLTVTGKTHHATYPGRNHFHFLHISLVKRKFHSVRVLSWPLLS